jgi:hypothetical protein
MTNNAEMMQGLVAAQGRIDAGEVGPFPQIDKIDQAGLGGGEVALRGEQQGFLEQQFGVIGTMSQPFPQP